MAKYKVEAAPNQRGVAIANGKLVLDEGDQAVVSDAEYTVLAALIADGVLLDLGVTTDALTPIPGQTGGGLVSVTPADIEIGQTLNAIPGATLADVLSATDEVVIQQAAEIDQKYSFRVWGAAPEELVLGHDFSTGKAPFTGSGSVLDMASAVGNSKPALTHALQHSDGNSGTWTAAALDVSAVLAGRTGTRMVVWVAYRHQHTNNSSKSIGWSLKINGGSVWSKNTSHNLSNTGTISSWEQVTINNPSGIFTAEWATTGSGAANAFMAIAGVQVFAAVPGWTGYKLGELVLHNGRVWKSEIPNNNSQPGVANWTPQVLGDPAWTTATLTNSWVALAGRSAPKYRINGSNEVCLKGAMSTGAIGSTAFTLPVGARPAETLVFSTAGATSGTQVTINTNGTVVASAGTNTHISLDGIVFLAEA